MRRCAFRCITGLLGVGLVVGAWTRAAPQPTWEQLRAFYDYDTSAPLSPVLQPPSDRVVSTVQDFTFASVNGQIVPGTLWIPKNTGGAKAPVIVCLHGLGGDRHQVAGVIAPFVCPEGVALLALDAQYHGARKVEGKELISADVEEMVAAFRQTILDYRRALDYIATRPELDASRVTLIGASMGAIMGSVLAAVDERIRSALLIVGGGDLVDLFATSEIEAVKEVRRQLGELEKWRAPVAFIEPAHFVAHISPRPLFMINGRQDQIVGPKNAQALYDAAREPKRIVWYDGGHVPPLDLLTKELWAFVQTQVLAAPR